MGTIFQIPWAYVCDEPQEWESHGAQILRRLGFKSAAMALCSDSVGIDDHRLMAEKKLAIVLGSEGERTEQGDYRRLRLHGEDTHVPRRGLTECGGCERGCILAASSEIALPQ